jgi:hypothetical protein
MVALLGEVSVGDKSAINLNLRKNKEKVLSFQHIQLPY